MPVKRNHYDVIVLGLGGAGSAAAYHLARRGLSVLGLDQYAPPHRRGSSHGQTRVIRQAYFEHPDYVPLLGEAFRLWRDLESRSGQPLLHLTGLIEVGPVDGVVVPGVLRSANRYGLAVESMTMRQAIDRFPGIDGDQDWQVLLEREAGYLDVERCVAAHLREARLAGAEILERQQVIDWSADDHAVTINTDANRYSAGQLVLAAGPWSGPWLQRFGVPLQVLRKHVHWYAASDDRYSEDRGFPCYFFETPQGYFYGTPAGSDRAVKVARHSGGEPVTSVDGDVHQPDDWDREQCEAFVARHLPAVTRTRTGWSGCYYTMSPDENFILDHLPGIPQVTVVAGLSGHGFKFTSVLGKLAAELAVRDSPSLDIDFLRLSRFGGS